MAKPTDQQRIFLKKIRTSGIVHKLKISCIFEGQLDSGFTYLFTLFVHFFNSLWKAVISFLTLLQEGMSSSFHNSLNPPLLTAFFEKL
jgi:hypothetical protein